MRNYLKECIMLKRSLEPILKTALKISPIVLLKGARQVGKSTLALGLSVKRSAEVVSF